MLVGAGRRQMVADQGFDSNVQVAALVVVAWHSDWGRRCTSCTTCWAVLDCALACGGSSGRGMLLVEESDQTRNQFNQTNPSVNQSGSRLPAIPMAATYN
jgi:hypothetical protein